MRKGKIWVSQTVTFFLIAGAIVLGVYLNQKPQTFTPKANLTATAAVFVNAQGQTQTQTASPLVKLKLTYVPSSAGVFPTDFRVANDNPSSLNHAQSQTFDENDKVINWVLSQGSGQKNVYIQFKVNGAWEDYIQASISENVLPQATYQVSTKTASASRGQGVTVSWNNSTGNPADWVGLYLSSASDANYLDMVYTNCSKDKASATRIILSGSCSLTIPATAPAGNYEFRMFSNGSNAQLGASSSFKVQ